MSTTIHNNFKLSRAVHIDAKLVPVANFAALPDPNMAANCIYEGAVIYVQDVKLNYQAQDDGSGLGTFAWVSIGGQTDALVVGSINLLPTATNIDLSTVSPAIANCYAVVISIVGGTTVNLNTFTNFPVDQNITFSTNESGQALSAAMGVSLNALIAAKLDYFDLGSHLYYTSGPGGNVLNVLPFGISQVGTTQATLALNITAETLAGINSNYFRVYSNQSEGSFILAPLADPSVTDNWIRLSQPIDPSLYCRTNFWYDAGLPAIAVGTYTPYIALSNLEGDYSSIIQGYNPDGSTTEKLNIKLFPGTYRIRAKLTLHSATPEDLRVSMFFTDALGTVAAPYGVGSTEYDADVLGPVAAAAVDNMYNMETTVTIVEGIQDILVFKVVSAAGNFAAVSMITPTSRLTGQLEIFKIRA